jgi:pimeloyl-[acyl-carrier protein] methyl ester esterase
MLPPPLTMKLVLLPGMDGTGTLFAGFVAAFPHAVDADVVRYSSGLGCLADISDILRSRVPQAEPFVLLAESFSTPIAIQYAATSPLNLKGLILCAGFAASPVSGWRQVICSAMAPVLAAFSLPDFAAGLLLVGPNAPKSLVASVRAAISSLPPKILAARMRAVLACDVRAKLSQVTVPILYLQATQDRLVHRSCLEEIRRIRPRTEVAAIAGPHLILQREPEQAAEIIMRFIEQHR